MSIPLLMPLATVAPQMRAIDPAPAASNSGWLAMAILGAVLGGGILAAGLWVLWGGRVHDRSEAAAAEPSAQGSWPVRWRASMTPATRSVVGLCLLILGYHAAAYLTPRGWFGLMVPPERWWLLIGAIAIAVGGSILVDRMVERGDADAG